MAIDYTTPTGQLRLLISDVDETNQVLSDDMIDGYLAMWGVTTGDITASRATVKRAAADALDAIATSEALVSKVIRTQDLSTDGPKTATALRDHAARLRAQADVDDEDDDGGYVDVAEFTPYPQVTW